MVHGIAGSWLCAAALAVGAHAIAVQPGAGVALQMGNATDKGTTYQCVCNAVTDVSGCPPGGLHFFDNDRLCCKLKDVTILRYFSKYTLDGKIENQCMEDVRPAKGRCCRQLYKSMPMGFYVNQVKADWPYSSLLEKQAVRIEGDRLIVKKGVELKKNPPMFELADIAGAKDQDNTDVKEHAARILVPRALGEKPGYCGGKHGSMEAMFNQQERECVIHTVAKRCCCNSATNKAVQRCLEDVEGAPNTTQEEVEVKYQEVQYESEELVYHTVMPTGEVFVADVEMRTGSPPGGESMVGQFLQMADPQDEEGLTGDDGNPLKFNWRKMAQWRRVKCVLKAWKRRVVEESHHKNYTINGEWHKLAGKKGSYETTGKTAKWSTYKQGEEEYVCVKWLWKTVCEAGKGAYKRMPRSQAKCMSVNLVTIGEDRDCPPGHESEDCHCEGKCQ